MYPHEGYHTDMHVLMKGYIQLPCTLVPTRGLSYRHACINERLHTVTLHTCTHTRVYHTDMHVLIKVTYSYPAHLYPHEGYHTDMHVLMKGYIQLPCTLVPTRGLSYRHACINERLHTVTLHTCTHTRVIIQTCMY